MTRLLHVSESKLSELREGVERNLERYLTSGFSDLVGYPGWSLELALEVDLSSLAELDGSGNRAETDLRNTLLVDRVLGSMSPSLANEERIWVRLSHVECLAYSRERWLSATATDEARVAAVRKHLFAATHTGIRDDHAIARLWWNAFIVRRCFPHDVERGLSLLLRSADVRSNFVERVWLTSRRPLAAGVFRKMDRDERVLASEESFRRFMKTLNVLGGGLVFEAMRESSIDALLDRCVEAPQLDQKTEREDGAA